VRFRISHGIEISQNFGRPQKQNISSHIIARYVKAESQDRTKTMHIMLLNYGSLRLWKATLVRFCWLRLNFYRNAGERTEFADVHWTGLRSERALNCELYRRKRLHDLYMRTLGWFHSRGLGSPLSGRVSQHSLLSAHWDKSSCGLIKSCSNCTIAAPDFNTEE
jgi:hypothetical protein